MTKQVVNLNDFSPQELYQLKQGFDSELTTLGQSMSQFRFAMDKYEEGRRAIKAAQDCKINQQMLIPLSNSLYIQGILNNNINNQKLYLIEYGAGFFVQTNAKDAIQFYQRKIALIKEKTTKLQEVINQKRQGSRACEIKIMSYLQTQQQQQQQQQLQQKKQ